MNYLDGSLFSLFGLDFGLHLSSIFSCFSFSNSLCVLRILLCSASFHLLVPSGSVLFVADAVFAFLLKSLLTVLIGLSKVEVSGKTKILNK